MISVRAWAGDARMTAASAAASRKNLKADLTIKPISQSNFKKENLNNTL
jgi:hypothetical protein